MWGGAPASALEDKKGVLKVCYPCGYALPGGTGLYQSTASIGHRRKPVLRRCDKRRAGYYHTCTARKWNDISNYHLILDSGKLGLEKCAEILAGML